MQEYTKNTEIYVDFARYNFQQLEPPIQSSYLYEGEINTTIVDRTAVGKPYLDLELVTFKGVGMAIRLVRRRHRVASDSCYRAPYSNAFTRHIRDEHAIHHSERKSFKLPCGKTIAQSWGGLRRAWLGFKIALANHDSTLMTHYASFISKVQEEMGVQVTKFDPEILDEPENGETIRVCIYEQHSEQIAGQEPDYDSIMENARGHLDHRHEKISEPRQNLFSDSRSGSRNACWRSRSTQVGQAKMESHKSKIIHGRKCCIYKLEKERPSQYEKEYSKTQKVQQEGVSSYASSRRSNQSEIADAHDEWQDEMYNENYEEENSKTNRRRSCSYKLKG